MTKKNNQKIEPEETMSELRHQVQCDCSCAKKHEIHILALAGKEKCITLTQRQDTREAVRAGTNLKPSVKGRK